MSPKNESEILKLAALKPDEYEQDTLMRNHDGSVVSVHNAPLIRALAKGLGVTFNIVMPEDNEYGFKTPDGNWNGIIGMLARGEADISLGGITVSTERREVVKFTYPLHVTDITFMTDKPEPNSKSFAIFDVFSFEVWIVIGLCLLLMSLFLYIFLKKSVTYSTILLGCIGCLLEKSLSFHARQRNTVLLLLHWFLGITVLINGYKAVILSVMTVPKMVGIRDITDLSKAARENSIMCMMHNGSALWQYELIDARIMSIGECLNKSKIKLLSGPEAFFKYPHKKAFIAERIDISKFSGDYFISDDSFSLSNVAIAYSSKFCCPKKLDGVIHHIVEAGLYTKLFRDKDFMDGLRQSKPKNEVHDSSQFKPLTLKDFAGAFYVLIIGHLCSLVIFIAEIITNRYIKTFKFTRNI